MLSLIAVLVEMTNIYGLLVFFIFFFHYSHTQPPPPPHTPTRPVFVVCVCNFILFLCIIVECMVVLRRLYLVKVSSPWPAFELTVSGLSASGILTPRTWQFTFSMLILLSCTFFIYALVNVVCGLLSEFVFFGTRKADTYFWQLLQNGELYCIWEIGDIVLFPRLLLTEHRCFVSGHWFEFRSISGALWAMEPLCQA